MISISKSDAGGYKEVIFSVNGSDIYSYLEYESGVHRCKEFWNWNTRKGTHISRWVAVLPEAEEVDTKIKDTT